MTQLKKFCPHSHFKLVDIDNGLADYSDKERTRVEGPWEYGERPIKRNCASDWK